MALAPFHAFLTVWLASGVGHYTALRLWPEVLLAGLGVVALAIWARDAALRTALGKTWLTRCIAAYCALLLVLGAVALARHAVTGAALGDGLVLDMRLPLFLLAAQVIFAHNEWLRIHWRKLVLIPAAIALVFGLLEIFVLPVGFLQHFGYGPHTIAPFETVDQKLAYVRAQATLRGANPLGAYLVIVLASLAGAGFKHRALWAKILMVGSFGAALVVLMYTYSRSAYIGAVVALAALVWWTITSKRLKGVAMVGAAAVLLVGAGAFMLLRHNSQFENTFFHTDTTSQSAESSNAARGSALRQGVREVAREPLGRGPGTAGPASAHNNHPARIAENYFLQIGQEAGWLGLGLFTAICVLAGYGLWQRRAEPLARVLLASLLGLTLINMLSHAWTDDTLAIIWWTLAGAALAPRLKQSKKVRA